MSRDVLPTPPHVVKSEEAKEPQGPVYVLTPADFMPGEEGEGISLISYLNVLLRRRWLIIGCSFLAIAAAYVFSKLQAPQYQASATFLVADTTASVMGEQSDAFFAALKNPGEYYKKVAVSSTILDELLAERFAAPEDGKPAVLLAILKVEGKTDQERRAKARESLAKAIELTNPRDFPNLMTLQVTAGSPQLAADLANKLIDRLKDYDVALRGANARERVKFIEQQITGVQKQLGTAEDALKQFVERNRLAIGQLSLEKSRLEREVQLQQEIFLTLKKELEIARIAENKEASSISIIDKALPPRYKSSPKTLLNMALAGVVGLMMSVFLAFLLEYFRKVKHDQEFMATMQDIRRDLGMAFWRKSRRKALTPVLLALLVGGSSPLPAAQDPGPQMKTRPSRTAEEPSQRKTKPATEVIGTQRDIKEEEFVQSIKKQERELPQFGYDVFNIDLSTMAPGPIDRDSYLVAPGDKLLVTVWGEINIQWEVAVSPDLYIYLGQPSAQKPVAGQNQEEQAPTSDIGRVYLGGQTLKQAEVSIARALSNLYSTYINPDDPSGSSARIELTPTEISEVRFLVQGEVAQPGTYSLHPSLSNLVYALAQAGGVRDTGSLRKIAIRRSTGTVILDFYDFLLKGSGDQRQYQVRYNDVIFVPMRTKEVTIQGEVRRPARYEVREGETLLDLVEMAGGLKPSASLEKALILRTEVNTGLKTIDINLKRVTESKTPVQLQDGDIVNVFPTYLKRIDFVSVVGEGAALPGEYQLRENMRVKDLIQEVGGLTGEAYLPRADLIRTRRDFTRYYKSIDLRRVQQDDPEHNLLLENMDQLVVYTVREIVGEEGTVSLSGHVKKPGRYTLYRGMRLFDLLFAKGGFQDENHLKKTYTERGDIRRLAEDGTTRRLIKFDLKKVLAGDEKENVALEKDDEIVIYSAEEIAGNQNQVKLSGHAKRPGQYQLLEGMRLMDLLDVAGGFQDREFRKQAFLERGDLVRWVRNGEQLERKLIRFNLGALLLGDDAQNLPLEPNDEIILYAARDFLVPKTVTIDGLVKRPGTFDYAENMTLGDLLVKAGGLLEGAYARAEISRMTADGNPDIKKEVFQVDVGEDFFRSDERAGFLLKNNDRVFVRKHPDFEKQAVVELAGEVNFPGRYVLGKQERVSELIKRAGGVKESGCVRAAVLTRRPPGALAEQPSQEELKEEDRQAGLQEKPAEPYRVVFDLKTALEAPGGEQDLFLEEGDRLEIPKFQNVVEVRGAVVNNIRLACVPGKTADYYINQAGGYVREADKDSVTVIFPDGRELKKAGSFLWLKRQVVEPMSIINVPFKASPAPVLRETRETRLRETEPHQN
ncbi:MAG: SLBB domain-containing protein [Acidobacteriota bacterium]